MSRIESEHKTNTPYGRLDKFTAVQELASKGFPVPPVFSTPDEAREWQQSGGFVMAMPYFAAPWDSAIFLPGLDSCILFDDLSGLEYHKKKWQNYIKDLSEGQKLYGYLERFGVEIDAPPQVSYFLQACVSRGTRDGIPSTSTMIVMDNGNLTHLGWQSSGFPTHGGVYKGNDHLAGEAFVGLMRDNNRLGDNHILNLFRRVKAGFNMDKNLQVEFAYGTLKQDDEDIEPQLYAVQVRDFPQLPEVMWHYGSDFAGHTEIQGVGAQTSDSKFRRFRKGHSLSIKNAIQYGANHPYVIEVEEMGWCDDDLVHAFPGMQGLWLRNRYKDMPLSHGLFSLIEMANIHGKGVLLG